MSSPRFVRLGAYVALVAFLSTSAASWHVGDDDGLCAAVALSGDDAGSAIRAIAKEDRAPQHCALCHWTRWVRSTSGASPGIVSPQSTSVTCANWSSHVRAEAVYGLLTGRSPPPLSL